VDVKIKEAVEFVGTAGKEGACSAFEETLVRFLPDV
jgi:hypothetical protein